MRDEEARRLLGAAPMKIPDLPATVEAAIVDGVVVVRTRQELDDGVWLVTYQQRSGDEPRPAPAPPGTTATLTLNRRPLVLTLYAPVSADSLRALSDELH